MIVPRRTRAALVATVSLLTLAACAGRTPPPSIRYDSDDFRALPSPPSRRVRLRSSRCPSRCPCRASCCVSLR